MNGQVFLIKWSERVYFYSEVQCWLEHFKVFSKTHSYLCILIDSCGKPVKEFPHRSSRPSWTCCLTKYDCVRSSGHLCFITHYHTSLTSNTHLLDNNDKPAALCVRIHVCLCICPLWGVKDSSPQWHGYPSRTRINTLSSLSHPPMAPPTMLPLGQMGAIIDVKLQVIGFSTLPSKKPLQNPHATSLREIKAQTDRE